MGFAGKKETANAVLPQKAPIGDWARQAAAEFPFLSRNDILGLAGMRALLAVGTERYSSTYITEGRHSPSEISAASTHSLLRCNIVHSGATVFSCGATKPDCTFVPDWQMQYMVFEENQTVIQVPRFRTAEDRIRCGYLMVQVRDAVKQVLANGIHLHLSDGPPNTDALVANVTISEERYSRTGNPVFGYDYLGGISDLHKQPLALPVAARDAVLAAVDATAYRSTPGEGDVLRTVSLAGPRAFDAGSVTVRSAGQTDQLVIGLPEDLPRTERQRSYRAALRLLNRIARALEEAEPAAAAALSAHAERIETSTHETWKAALSGPMIAGKERAREIRENELLRQYWTTSIAAPVVPVTAGRWYPVAVRVTTPATDVNYVSRGMEAADWVSNFKRTSARGVRQAARDSSRVFSARRCGLLRNTEGKALPFLRYVWQPDWRDRVTVAADPVHAWFWEVNARAAAASEASDQNSGVLFVTGWSHGDGVLGYGENLLTMLQAFAEVVSAFDPQARIQTLYLAT